MFEKSPRPQYTPWGQPQDANERAPGIWQVSTSSHGGMILSNERAAAMPDALLAGNFIEGRHHFEEDCDWSRVVVAFANEFPPLEVAAARRVLAWIAEKQPTVAAWVARQKVAA